MKIDFQECTLAKLDDLFDLEEVQEIPALKTWLSSRVTISDVERQILENLKQKLNHYVNDWNETELIIEFIGPLLSLVDFSEKGFHHFFAQRPFGGKIGDVELSGRPDGMIASGKRLPRNPYFCFQAYKQENDPEGEPAGQVLSAMLVAQEQNENEQPIYGCYVKGRLWFFIVLQGKQYSISAGDVATQDSIFTIFSVLKGLKPIIRELINEHKSSDNTR